MIKKKKKKKKKNHAEFLNMFIFYIGILRV